ncbi:MAG: DUF4412 domain-containing protein [Bacteroidia bacterium]
MKKTHIYSLLLLISSAFSTVFAQSGLHYEYKITGASPQGSVTGNMEFMLLNGNTRMEMRMNVPSVPVINMVMLTLQQKSGFSYELMDAAKAYVEHNTTGTPSVYEVMQVAGAEKLGVFNATKVKIKIDGEEQWMWISKDVTGYSMFASMRNKDWDMDALFKALKAKGVEGFPVKMQQTEEGFTTSIEMVKAEQKPLDAKLFIIPADYKKQTTLSPGIQGMPQIDPAKLMQMSEEEREKFLQEIKKQHGIRDEEK